MIQLVCLSSSTVSTNNDTSLCGSFRPTHHSIIRTVCHIDCAQLIDEHSLRIRQLCPIIPFTSTTSHDNPFFRTLHPLHHTMIVEVRHVHRLISIDKAVVRLIELMETITLSFATRHHYSIRLSHSISSHFMLSVV